MLAIGIDLGGTNIKAALVDREKGILNQTSIPTEADRGRNHVLDQLAHVAKDVAGNHDGIIGIGMGSPGIISLDRTTVSNPPNLPGWDVVPISAELKERTGWDCRVENDANLAALGSARFGVGKEISDFIMVTLGTGVGGGIIYNNFLYRGATGGAAELGHVIIDYNGPFCNSPAQGAIEGYLGQRFLSKRAWDIIKNHSENPLYSTFKDNHEDLDPLALFNAAEEGNQIAIDILADAGEKLGIAIVNYIHVLDIRKVIISGGVAKAGKYIINPAKDAALKRLLNPFKSDFDIVYEHLGNEAAILGAASLAFESLTE